MLEPVELLLTPSCLDCLSWSADGDLAIAAGEHVHILTPNPNSSDNLSGDVSQSVGNQWVITKLQTNLFSNEDWPPVLPQLAETFSIGEEQSESHVVALSWSPPGLAVYGRCILSVLTSNLILSLWEATDGHGQWARVAIVNHSLQKYFQASTEHPAVLMQKQRVRTFSWSPGCKFSDRSQRKQEPAHPRKKCERYLLAITNDTSDLVVLDARNMTSSRDGVKGLHTEISTVFQLPSLERPTYNIARHSLFAQSFKGTEVPSRISWGPWVETATNGGDTIPTHVSAIGLIRGSAIGVLRVGASIRSEEKERNRLELQFRDWNISSHAERTLGRVKFKGPLSWIRAKSPGHITLMAGTQDGCVSFTLSDQNFMNPELDTNRISVQKHGLGAYESDDAGTSLYDWYPVTGVAQVFHEPSQTLAVDVANFSFHTTSLTSQDDNLIAYNVANQSFESDWRKQVDEFRQQFDLDYDMNGSSMAKIWGLAGFRGWVAACCSFHPVDLFEHHTMSQHHVRIVFSRPFLESEDKLGSLESYAPWLEADLDPESLQDARANVLSFTLDPVSREPGTCPSSHKVQYAAACSVLMQPELYPHFLPAAKSAIELLAAETNLDFSQELSLIEVIEKNLAHEPVPSTTMAIPQTQTGVVAKSRDQLSALGAQGVFETCEICGSSIQWYSPTESQCMEGHIFVRCGVSFLSIQDPMCVKYCSRCGIEVLNGDALDGEQTAEPDGPVRSSMLEILLDNFNSCAYCGSKFRT